MKPLFLAFFFLSVFAQAAFSADGRTSAEKDLEKRQRIELLGFFMKDPSQAKLPQTPVAIDLYNEGVRMYEKKEYDMALEAFQESLKYDPRNALAHELIGDIYYFQQRMPEAKKNYLEAFKLQPREALKEKLERLREETIVEKELSTYREQHFIIKYRDDDKSYDGFEIREMLRELYGVISKDFGFYFNHKVVVLLYSAAEFKELTKLPHWASGVYDGKIRIPAYHSDMSEQEFKALTAHEMTHAFVAAMSRGRAPVWINEGLAEFEENKHKKNTLSFFKAAVKSNGLIKLDSLMTMSALDQQNAMVVSLFYEQSFHLTNYLVERYGMFRIKQLLDEFGKGKTSDEALRNTLKISVERLEREWKDTI